MFAYAGDHATSLEAFNVLIQNRRDPALAAWAADWNARMVAGTDGAAVLAELRRVPASDAAFREWTVAGNVTMENVARAAGVADLRDYLDGLKNRGGSPAAKQIEQEIEAHTTAPRIDIP